MNLTTNLQRIWVVTAIISLGLLIYFWVSETESPALLNALLALDAVMLFLALPSGIFGAGVIFAAWYVLEMNPFSSDGVYLNTIVLFLLGTVQWFWLIRFYYPPESPFQKLTLAN